MPHRHAGPPFHFGSGDLAGMTTAGRWLEGLRRFAAARRAAEPPRSPGPAAQAAAERSIIGAALATSLAELDAVRAVRRSLPAADPFPAIVLTTSAVGIAAAEEMLASTPELAALADGRLVAVTELEYRLWCMRSPDEPFSHHVNLWNWVKTAVPRQRWGEFAAHPLAAGEAYWLHRTGRAGAGPLDARACHLWKWNGRQAVLLEPFVPERGVGPLGPRRDRDRG